MNTVVKTKFAVKPVVAALALAFSAVNAYADPTLIAQPGAGLIRAVTPGALFVTNTTATTGFVIAPLGGSPGTGTVGDQIYDGYALSELRLTSPTPFARGVIQWGKVPGSAEFRNPGGFNIGQNAKLTFTSGLGVTDAAVLNIDASGNQSQIFGLLESSIVGDTVFFGAGTTGAAPSIFVANANGIIIGPLGHIVAPTGPPSPDPLQLAGVGLIAANMNNSNSIQDFVANNNQIPAAPGAIPPGASYLNYTGALGKIELQGGAIDGSTVANQPAQYILLAGSEIINNGILFGKDIHIAAGTTAVTGAGVINGAATAVNRYWLTDQATAGPLVSNSLCGVPGCSEILAANKAGGFTNTGTVASKFLVSGGLITINAADGGITSGIVGDPDLLVGLFADSGTILNATGPIVLANVVSGYTTGVTLPFLSINQAVGYGGDVLIEALTPGSQPSSITTLDDVNIFGANIVINSTINYTPLAGNLGDLNIFSTQSLTSSAAGDIGAGFNVNIVNTGPGGINLAGDVYSGLSAPPVGGGSINIVNANKGASTTLAGDLITFFFTPDPDDINVTVNGPLDIGGGPFPFTLAADEINIVNNGVNAPTVIHDTIVETRLLDVNITVMGPLDIQSTAAIIADVRDVNIVNNGQAGGNTTTIAGDVFAEHDINIINNGGFTSNLNISGALTVGDGVGFSDITVISDGNLQLGTVSAIGVSDDIFIAAGGSKVWLNGPQTAGDFWEFHAPNATTKLLPAAVITAGDTVILEALHFQGVNELGNPYLTILEKPTAQIRANNVYATLYGSMNAPILGNTDWTKNQMQIEALDPTIPIFFEFSAVGGGFQAINIGFTGDAFVSSGLTRTPFDTVGFVGSVLLPPPLVANGGSSLILQATGNMDIVGNGAPFLLAPNAFEFPGGLVLIAGTSGTGVLTSQVPIYNAWTTNPGMPFQGIWKEAPIIIDGSYNATNLNNWVNYSTFPVTGPGNAYYITQPAPGVFQFVLDPLIVHHNTYSSAVVGGPIDFCPGGFPPYCP